MCCPVGHNSCRKELGDARSEFEQANAIDEPMVRLNAVDKLCRAVLLRWAGPALHKINFETLGFGGEMADDVQELAQQLLRKCTRSG